MAGGSRLLVTDFDGTMARQDFYRCVVDRLLTEDDLGPWHDYAAGRISHFESLRQIFARIRVPEAELRALLDLMEFDPGAAAAIELLRAHNWDVWIVSNGCGWYTEQLLARQGIDVPVHTNPGEYDAAHGLQVRLPTDSPFLDPDVGVSKAAVVRQAIASGQYEELAFAGDGRPDREPALLVDAGRRFARGWLAETLAEQGRPFVAFDVWSEISETLCGESQ